MSNNRNVNKGSKGLPQRLLAGITGSTFATIISIGIFSGMVSKGIIPEESVGYCAVAVLLFSIMVGSGIAISKSTKRMRISLYMGVIYCVLLLATTAVLFGAEYQGIGVTIFIVVIGCVLTVIVYGKLEIQ